MLLVRRSVPSFSGRFCSVALHALPGLGQIDTVGAGVTAYNDTGLAACNAFMLEATGHKNKKTGDGKVDA